MKKTYKEEIKCWVCEGKGRIMVVNFRFVALKSRICINVKSLSQLETCPVCEGKCVVQLIWKKLT